MHGVFDAPIASAPDRCNYVLFSDDPVAVPTHDKTLHFSATIMDEPALLHLVVCEAESKREVKLDLPPEAAWWLCRTLLCMSISRSGGTLMYERPPLRATYAGDDRRVEVESRLDLSTQQGPIMSEPCRVVLRIAEPAWWGQRDEAKKAARPYEVNGFLTEASAWQLASRVSALTESMRTRPWFDEKIAQLTRYRQFCES